MSDKLKQFIEDNRDAFDSENPGPGLLVKLKKQLGQGGKAQKIFEIKPVQWAVAMAGLIILSVVLYYSLQRKNDKEGIVKTTPSTIEEKISVSDPVYAK